MSVTSTNENIERGKTPIPRGAYQFVNPIIKFILRSPFHGVLSHAMMILTFGGRRSGKVISVPEEIRKKSQNLVFIQIDLDGKHE